MARRRDFSRPQANRNYRKLYIIATEGSETEPAYFGMFQSKNAIIKIELLRSRKKSAPGQVLRRAELHIAEQNLRPTDAVWIVLDRDTWEETELNRVCQTCKDKGYYLAVSTPCFEYWLLLHFEKGSGITNASNCGEKLLQHLPTFAKSHVETEKFRSRIPTAIAHAEEKDIPPCIDWPHGNGSTVYRLVKQLISVED